jgi:hypothetical protein
VTKAGTGNLLVGVQTQDVTIQPVELDPDRTQMLEAQGYTRAPGPPPR